MTSSSMVPKTTVTINNLVINLPEPCSLPLTQIALLQAFITSSKQDIILHKKSEEVNEINPLILLKYRYVKLYTKCHQFIPPSSLPPPSPPSILPSLPRSLAPAPFLYPFLASVTPSLCYSPLPMPLSILALTHVFISSLVCSFIHLYPFFCYLQGKPFFIDIVFSTIHQLCRNEKAPVIHYLSHEGIL